MSELKRCPFCGGEAEITTTKTKRGHIAVISCTKCSCRKARLENPYYEGDIFQDAVKSWNTRKPMQNIVERFEENLQKIEEKRKMAESEADKLRFFNFEMALRKAVSIVKEEGGIDGSNL